METRTVSMDFFRVTVKAADFGKLLRDIAGDAEEDRNVTLKGHVYRLQQLQKQGQLLIGEMVRLRMDEAALKARLSGGEPDLISLLEDEGLADETAFAYHAGLQVLVMQRHKFGTSPWALAGYVEEASGFAPVLFEPILERDALRKMAKMKNMRVLDFQIAGVEQRVYEGLGLSLKELGRLSGRLGAPQVRVRLSMGHASGSMDDDEVKRLATALLEKVDEGNVTRIRITGRDSSGNLEPLDLLRHRMVEFAEVELDGKRMPHRARAAALATAFEKRDAELRSMIE